jgi:hypothetical protein
MQDTTNPILTDLMNIKPDLGWAIKKYLDERNGKLVTKRI